jgi:alpha-beta hydrolase superfamily lysophospholipase
VCFFLLNAMAHRQAQALTCFAGPGDPFPAPEALDRGSRRRAILGGSWIPKPTNVSHPRDLGLPCETLELKTADGLRLEAWHLAHSGARGLAVMLPGYRLPKCTLVGEARALQSMGYACLLVDFRGHGGSEGRVTSLGYREALDVEAACAWARRRGGPVLLYGSSMGVAAVLRAVALGLAAPDGLILESPFDRLVTTLRRRLRLLRLPAWPAAELIVFWGGRQLRFDAFRHNPRDYAAAISTPAVILHAEGDLRSTLDDARRVVAALRGPSRLVTFPGSRHGGLHGLDSHRWIRAVGPLLDDLGRASPRPDPGRAPGPRAADEFLPAMV